MSAAPSAFAEWAERLEKSALAEAVYGSSDATLCEEVSLRECREIAALLRRAERLESLTAGFADTVEAAAREWGNIAAGRKGMQVPFHGDFGGVHQPSTKARLRWWAKAFRAALARAKEAGK